MSEKIAVIGAGQMGGGIAHVAALSGYAVIMIDVAESALEKGRSTIAANLDRQVKKGSIDAAARDSRLTAQLQGAVEANLRRQLGLAELAPQSEVIAEREQHLQLFTEQYLLYAYRYLRDDELQQYAALLQQPALQQLLDQVEREMVAVIAAAG